MAEEVFGGGELEECEGQELVGETMSVRECLPSLCLLLLFF